MYEQINKIADDLFGVGYLDIADHVNKDICRQVTDKKGDVLAFAISFTMTSDEAEVYFQHDFGESIGVIKTVAVREDQQGKGIGAWLVQDALAQLKDTHKVLTVAWRKGEEIPIEKTLTKLGFTKLFSIPNFWSEYACPYCGDTCKCTAEIFSIDK